MTYTIPTTITGGPAPGSFTYTAKATPPAGQLQSVLFNNLGTDTDTVSTALFVLTTTKDPAGNGTGTITSVPAGIDCGVTCSASYATGTQVALTALPTAGSAFTGWTGACSGSANPCIVTIAAAAMVTARFDKPVLVTALATTSNGGSPNLRPGDTADFSVKLQIPGRCTSLFILTKLSLRSGTVPISPSILTV